MCPAPEIGRLTKVSSKDQMKAAMSSCVATEVKAGKSQDQAVAMCSEMIRGQMGNEAMPPPAGGK